MTNWITEARLAHQAALASKPLCFVCDKPHSDHGSYPTCATHPYSPDGRCGRVGTFADGRFTGLSCIGAECRNGCARAACVAPIASTQPPRLRDALLAVRWDKSFNNLKERTQEVVKAALTDGVLGTFNDQPKGGA